jgi:DNA polymerase-3 subunit epsilon
MSEVIWIDCETGGTDEKVHALVQLSAIIEIDGKIVDEIDLKMKPFDKKIVEPKALEVQGRTMADIASFEDPRVCFERFRKFLARRPASKQNRYIMAGYNADFDCRFISEWYKDLSGGPYAYWDYMQFSPVDPIGILRAMRHYGIIDTPDTKLGTMCKYFGIELDAHDSMNDIRATRELTNMLMNKIKSNWQSQTYI